MIETNFIPKIAGEQALAAHQVAAVASLLSDGATIPFIARYRKEATGSLDEVAITTIRDRLNQLQDLDNRLTMIPDIQPIADIFPVTIHRQTFSLHGIVENQGDQFFGKLIGAVVI